MRPLFICCSLILLLITCVFGFISVNDIETEPSGVPTPKIFAHRGAIDRFNESTITSYEIAIMDNIDAVEIDLRMTKDDVLIAMHDETIDRTTNGTGKVSQLTLDEIKSFETIGYYHGKIKKEEVPTLEEIFQKFHNRGKYYIETRLVDGKVKMEAHLVNLLKKYDLLDPKYVAMQSFSEESLEKIKELAPEITLTLLFKEGEFQLKKALDVEFPVIGLEASDATAEGVKALHRKGKEVHVFFNDIHSMEEQQRKMKELNVDGYFTDDISFTKQLLKK